MREKYIFNHRDSSETINLSLNYSERFVPTRKLKSVVNSIPKWFLEEMGDDEETKSIELESDEVLGSLSAKESDFLDDITQILVESVEFSSFLGYDGKIRVLPEIKVKIESNAITGLYIKDLNAERLPESLGNLMSLKSLIMDNNYMALQAKELKSLPASIGNLKSLEKFSLFDVEGVKLFPDSFWKLRSLKHLRIDGRNDVVLNDAIQNFERIETIIFSGVFLHSLPSCIGNLHSLKKIILGESDLKEVPESIGNLTSLEILDLSRNKLTHLPDSMGNLASLKMMDLTLNEIKVLPDSFGNLKALEDLYLAHNEISDLPDSMSGLKCNIHWNVC